MLKKFDVYFINLKIKKILNETFVGIYMCMYIKGQQENSKTKIQENNYPKGKGKQF